MSAQRENAERKERNKMKPHDTIANAVAARRRIEKERKRVAKENREKKKLLVTEMEEIE
jgi:hypothetical protein